MVTAYCAALGIAPPRMEDARSSAEANYYSLLLVALLERGEPMTLEGVAARFAAAGVAPTEEQALRSLKRCKPARAPIYRVDSDGDLYALDPHDDEVSFWLFRLGLRPARGAPLRAVQHAYGPLPSRDHPVTIDALDEAWREGVPTAWSAQRVAVAVLDAHQSAMSGGDVMAFVAARSRGSPLRAESAQYWRRGAVIVHDDGLWKLDPRHDAVRSIWSCRARVASAVRSATRGRCTSICAAAHTPNSDADWRQTRSRSTRSISTGAFTVPFASLGGSSTRCCPRPGFTEMSPRCTTC